MMKLSCMKLVALACGVTTCINVFGVESEEVNGYIWKYIVENYKAKVCAVYPEQGDIVIPSKLGNRTVAKIGERAFWECSGITSITIPSGVVEIGAAAFWGCTGVETITMSPNVKNIADETFYECYKLSSVTIPEGVTNIGNCAFFYCRSLTGLSVPQGVTSIGSRAFAGCEGLADKNGFVIVRGVLHCYASDFSAANVPSGVTTVEDYAFAGRQNLQTVDFPLTLEKVGGWAFSGCSSLRAVYYRSPLPPATGTAIYQKCPDGMVSYVSWTPSSDSWCGAQWIHWDPSEEEEDVVIPTVVTNQVFVTVTNYVFVTTTNVTINYVLNSIRPEAAIPASPDSGFVNVITEVKGGCVAVPETWAAGIEGFSDKFGTDFAKALVAKTGKKDGSGSDMCVWQDYVAGTDPTDVNDVFIASIAMVGGVPKIGYTPELCEAEKAKRKYTIWGKIRLQDSDWVEVEMGHESDYNFFKVSVEMR